MYLLHDFGFPTQKSGVRLPTVRKRTNRRKQCVSDRSFLNKIGTRHCMDQLRRQKMEAGFWIRIRPRRIFLAWTCLAALMLAGTYGHAQIAGTGNIQGSISDQSGAVVQNATITITDTATQVQHTTKSDR